MSESRIPGLKAQHAIITPTCRTNRGVVEAFDEAVRRLKGEYLACSGDANAGATFHLVLTVERPRHSDEWAHRAAGREEASILPAELAGGDPVDRAGTPHDE